MTLKSLENSKNINRLNDEEEAKRKRKLLDDARQGKIETAEAKELYISELKKERKELLFPNKEEIEQILCDFDVDCVLYSLKLLGYICGGTISLTLLLICILKSEVSFFVILPYLITSTMGTIFASKISSFLVKSFLYINKLISNIFKYRSKRKVVRHKIKKSK